jgi:hypothetical protein
MGNSLATLIWVQKGVLSLVAVVFAMVLALTGRIDSSDALDFCKWVLTAWLVAQGAEDVAAHFSGFRTQLALDRKAKITPPQEKDHA